MEQRYIFELESPEVAACGKLHIARKGREDFLHKVRQDHFFAALA